MLPFRSIKSLYPLALAEGEGIGTAYEYFAKRLVLAPWLAKISRPRNLLIAGLPEKYGFSLDFLLLADEMAVAHVVVIDERPRALDQIRQSLAAAQAVGELTRVHPDYTLVTNMGRLDELNGTFDLCLGCGVLQRLGTVVGRQYVARLAKLATALALFAPNKLSHTTAEGLSGLGLTELRVLVEPAGEPAHMGYVDMPPWRPGLTRSAPQRHRAASGQIEGLAMWALGHYARLHPYLPFAWRRRQSHIVYALIQDRELCDG